MTLRLDVLGLALAVVAVAIVVATFRHRQLNYLPPLLILFAGPALWFFLVFGGIGAQSLANVVEVPIAQLIGLVAALLSYAAQVSGTSVRSANLIATAAVIAGVCLLRLTMPLIPE